MTARTVGLVFASVLALGLVSAPLPAAAAEEACTKGWYRFEPAFTDAVPTDGVVAFYNPARAPQTRSRPRSRARHRRPPRAPPHRRRATSPARALPRPRYSGAGATSLNPRIIFTSSAVTSNLSARSGFGAIAGLRPSLAPP